MTQLDLIKLDLTEEMLTAKLCYVRYGFAYFTTNFDDQWGDDWNDAPYEHNAGHPYEWNDHAWKDKPEWKIYSVAYQCKLDTPDTNQFNSPYSVEMINNKVVPWLKPDKYEKNQEHRIWAGATMSEFITIVKEVGGSVFVKIQ